MEGPEANLEYENNCSSGFMSFCLIKWCSIKVINSTPTDGEESASSHTSTKQRGVHLFHPQQLLASAKLYHLHICREEHQEDHRLRVLSANGTRSQES